MKNNNKLNAKDLMNVGIFTAIVMVIGIAIACTLGYIPILFMLLAIITPIATGIPMMLYYTKIKKAGMLMLTSIINGLIMVFTGMGYYTLLFGIFFTFFAELIIKSGDYRSAKKSVLSFGVYSMALVGNYVPWLVATESHLKNVRTIYGEAYTNIILSYFTNSWIIPALILAGFVGGILGGILGRKVFKKHFERSGII